MKKQVWNSFLTLALTASLSGAAFAQGTQVVTKIVVDRAVSQEIEQIVARGATQQLATSIAQKAVADQVAQATAARLLARMTAAQITSAITAGKIVYRSGGQVKEISLAGLTQQTFMSSVTFTYNAVMAKASGETGKLAVGGNETQIKARGQNVDGGFAAMNGGSKLGQGVNINNARRVTSGNDTSKADGGTTLARARVSQFKIEMDKAFSAENEARAKQIGGKTLENYVQAKDRRAQVEEALDHLVSKVPNAYIPDGFLGCAGLFFKDGVFDMDGFNNFMGTTIAGTEAYAQTGVFKGFIEGHNAEVKYFINSMNYSPAAAVANVDKLGVPKAKGGACGLTLPAAI